MVCYGLLVSQWCFHSDELDSLNTELLDWRGDGEGEGEGGGMGKEERMRGEEEKR